MRFSHHLAPPLVILNILLQIERNALVSVALRLLEYHRGVLFLTTNRIKTFDDAFLSRFSIGNFLSRFLRTRQTDHAFFLQRSNIQNLTVQGDMPSGANLLNWHNARSGKKPRKKTKNALPRQI